MDIETLLEQEQSIHQALDAACANASPGQVGMETVYVSAADKVYARDKAALVLDGIDVWAMDDNELVGTLEGIYEDIVGRVSRLFGKSKIIEVDELTSPFNQWATEHLGATGPRGTYTLKETPTIRVGQLAALFRIDHDRALDLREIHKAASADSSVYTQQLVKYRKHLQEVNRVLMDVVKVASRTKKTDHESLRALGEELTPHMAKLKQLSLAENWEQPKHKFLAWGDTSWVFEDEFDYDHRFHADLMDESEIPTLTQQDIGKYSRLCFQFRAIAAMAEDSIAKTFALNNQSNPLAAVRADETVGNEYDWDRVDSEGLHDKITGMWYLIAKRATIMSGAMAAAIKLSMES